MKLNESTENGPKFLNNYSRSELLILFSYGTLGALEVDVAEVCFQSLNNKKAPAP